MTELIRMTIKGLMLDPVSNSPIVVLKDSEEKIFLPIWVGIFEANAIALKLESIETPRPMTHDLLRTVIEQLNGSVKEIHIGDLRESTFYATIKVLANGSLMDIDARPSDAIALALRTDAPILVSQAVIDQAQTITVDESQDDKLKKWLESVSPEDLGKYKM